VELFVVCWLGFAIQTSETRRGRVSAVARLGRGIWKSFLNQNHAQKTDLTNSSTMNNEQQTKNIYVMIALWQPHFRGGFTLRMTGQARFTLNTKTL